MSRYSSDSDCSSHRRRSRRKRRSSSSSSSDSSHRRRSKSSKHYSSARYKKSTQSYSRSYRRSRSRSKTSSRHSRSVSKDRRRRRSYSREKYRHKRHYKSQSSKYQSRSSSSDSNSSSSSSSKSSSNTSIKKNQTPTPSSVNPEEQLREKLLKAIKAAESADHQLKQQGVLPKGVKSRNDISSLTSSKPQSDVIKDINADEFVPKTFTSSKQKKEDNYDELNVPGEVEGESVEVDGNSIFHASFFVDPKAKMDRWVRKLFTIRQRAISGEPLAT